MDSLKLITLKSGSDPVEGTIVINTDIIGEPILEYYHNGEWVSLDNFGTIHRMARLDDLYTQFYYRGWGVGPRLSSQDGDLYLHTKLYNSPIPVISKDEGIKVSGYTTDELTEDMIKEIDIYYDSLISARDFLEGSSVVDLWEYPVEYGGTLNLNTLPVYKNRPGDSKVIPVINLSVAWTISGVRKTDSLMFIPWSTSRKINGDFGWIDFQSSLGDREVTVEFQDGCLRVFPEDPGVTECIIQHCSATYDGLL